MVRATKVLAKGRRPTGDQSFIVTSGGSIVVNVKKLVSSGKYKALTKMLRERRESGDVRIELEPAAKR